MKPSKNVETQGEREEGMNDETPLCEDVVAFHVGGAKDRFPGSELGDVIFQEGNVRAGEALGLVVHLPGGFYWPVRRVINVRLCPCTTV